MIYQNVVEGTFISRPNRFIAKVLINGKEETVHVKNTGRCKELLIEGATVYLQKSNNPGRKTEYDLIAVIKNGNCINMDSYAPNIAAGEWISKSGLFSEYAIIKAEKFFGESRFDFYIIDGERQAYMEVKGVTLEENGIALFPDAPTVRGVKHINELISCKKQGYEAYILFVIQMKGIKKFTPNYKTHKEFGEALARARDCGVEILAMDCAVTPDSMIIENPISICF